jgi:hypothetical protein
MLKDLAWTLKVRFTGPDEMHGTQNVVVELVECHASPLHVEDRLDRAKDPLECRAMAMVTVGWASLPHLT